MERLTSDGISHFFPKPRNQENEQITEISKPETETFNQTIFYSDAFNQSELPMLCNKTETESEEQQRPNSEGLSKEDRQFIEKLKRRIEKRKQGQITNRQCLVQKLTTFFIFFVLHCITATFAKNYQQYQTFLATQFCGFITIMFWDNN
ncbi:PREDICTED: uncharacterized protein LOC105368543 [Ceratosolen solmsi marchali]|uniref:Uncharacterized protein LOC105368543 n=1 Tax=Ceratosolen solmsi marchali TaxID=326594 RepID=A0AAJ7E2X4_9HYME|nr:PREDICTED: uncharacterized protein LOC105368543 [Ceratosolen solmsi marchali]